jgi:hypothetical protein
MVEQVASGMLTDWQRAHDELTRLSRTRAGLEFEEGVWLLAAERARTHAHLGYGSVLEYAERLFGHAPRLTQEKLRVAAALEHLPELARALRHAELSWSAVRELTRVATATTERAWLATARTKTAREVERLVSGRRPGSLPTDVADPALQRHVLRFEVTGEVLATFRDALAEIRRISGGPLDDDTALLLLARHVLAGPADEAHANEAHADQQGRANYQVAITLCPSCRVAIQSGRGEPIQVSPDIVAMAECDAQLIPDPHARSTDHPPRATQTIPPALRRAILRRDHGRCQVPGCTHATFVDIHHIVPRAKRGRNEADNLITLCGAHHRALHRGALRIERKVSNGLRFSHADGRAYGATPHAPASFVLTASARDALPPVSERAPFPRAFAALRSLGFPEREARRALAEIQTHVGADLALEPLLRQAVALLTQPAIACRP